MDKLSSLSMLIPTRVLLPRGEARVHWLPYWEPQGIPVRVTWVPRVPDRYGLIISGPERLKFNRSIPSLDASSHPTTSFDIM